MSNNIKIHGKILSRYNEIISDEALRFVQEIHKKFNINRLKLLNERIKRQLKEAKILGSLNASSLDPKNLIDNAINQ